MTNIIDATVKFDFTITNEMATKSGDNNCQTELSPNACPSMTVSIILMKEIRYLFAEEARHFLKIKLIFGKNIKRIFHKKRN